MNIFKYQTLCIIITQWNLKIAFLLAGRAIHFNQTCIKAILNQNLQSPMWACLELGTPRLKMGISLNSRVLHSVFTKRRYFWGQIILSLFGNHIPLHPHRFSRGKHIFFVCLSKFFKKGRQIWNLLFKLPLPISVNARNLKTVLKRNDLKCKKNKDTLFLFVSFTAIPS